MLQGGTMIVLTGPQKTQLQRKELASLAEELNACMIDDEAVNWFAVKTLYVLPGWDSCPSALADVGVAAAFGLSWTLHTP